MTALFLYCRAGFEDECVAEIQEAAKRHNIGGYCKTKPRSGYVLFHSHQAKSAVHLYNRLSFRNLIFPRQWFVVLGFKEDLLIGDRINPFLEASKGLPGGISDLFLETVDTNEGKTLSPLCRALSKPLQQALRNNGLWQTNGLCFHIVFLSGTAAYWGYAHPSNSSPWPMGIPRLRFPRGAPSRAALKLEEAFLHFLSVEEKENCFHAGAYAVDLGAAPGGWTWQLIHRHMRVIAVDNGAMAPGLLASGRVCHRHEDAYHYQPPQKVEWMVCDIVDKPMIVTELMARWFVKGWCKRAMFNLKLPMKRRYQEAERCLKRIDEILNDEGIKYTCFCKHLYHDREEVTVYLVRIS